jgi:hypothetical protein
LQDFWEGFANFLFSGYMIEPPHKNHGSPLAIESAFKVLNGMMQWTSDRFKATGSNAMQRFLTARDSESTTPEAKWFRGLKDQLNRHCFERAKAAGESLDNSEDPLYLEAIKAMMKAYSTVEGVEPCVRKMSIATGWFVAGRSAETAWITVPGLAWDTLQECRVSSASEAS